ncbi:MAG TPA: hypothetical protein VFW49_10865 [Fluviicoccus sp.]|nr:hypothetical protein [Fluviicoccus sp.]
MPFTLPPRDTWIDRTSDIRTDLDTLYALLSDLDRWPEWTPGLRAIVRRGKGVAAPGDAFLMVLDAPVIRALPLPCTVYRNEPNYLEWGGGALGSVIRHSLELTAIDANTTRLRHVEYATGLLAVLTRPVARLARGHDMRWSDAIEARFRG